MLPRYVELPLPYVAHLVDHRAAGHHTERQRQPEERLQQHQILHVEAVLVAVLRHAEDGRVNAERRNGRGQHQPTQCGRMDGREVEERRFRGAYVGLLFFHL